MNLAERAIGSVREQSLFQSDDDSGKKQQHSAICIDVSPNSVKDGKSARSSQKTTVKPVTVSTTNQSSDLINSKSHTNKSGFANYSQQQPQLQKPSQNNSIDNSKNSSSANLQGDQQSSNYQSINQNQNQNQTKSPFKPLVLPKNPNLPSNNDSNSNPTIENPSNISETQALTLNELVLNVIQIKSFEDDLMNLINVRDKTKNLYKDSSVDLISDKYKSDLNNYDIKINEIKNSIEIYKQKSNKNSIDLISNLKSTIHEHAQRDETLTKKVENLLDSEKTARKNEMSKYSISIKQLEDDYARFVKGYMNGKELEKNFKNINEKFIECDDRILSSQNAFREIEGKIDLDYHNQLEINENQTKWNDNQTNQNDNFKKILEEFKNRVSELEYQLSEKNDSNDKIQYELMKFNGHMENQEKINKGKDAMKEKIDKQQAQISQLIGAVNALRKESAEKKKLEHRRSSITPGHISKPIPPNVQPTTPTIPSTTAAPSNNQKASKSTAVSLSSDTPQDITQNNRMVKESDNHEQNYEQKQQQYSLRQQQQKDSQQEKEKKEKQEQERREKHEQEKKDKLEQLKKVKQEQLKKEKQEQEKTKAQAQVKSNIKQSSSSSQTLMLPSKRKSMPVPSQSSQGKEPEVLPLPTGKRSNPRISLPVTSSTTISLDDNDNPDDDYYIYSTSNTKEMNSKKRTNDGSNYSQPQPKSRSRAVSNIR